jgi:hypothetical protein
MPCQIYIPFINFLKKKSQFTDIELEEKKRQEREEMKKKWRQIPEYWDI